MSEKHVRLAAFAQEHVGEPFAAQMALWNTLYPEWEYSHTTNFGRDCHQAIERVRYREHLRLEELRIFVDGLTAEERQRVLGWLLDSLPEGSAV
jgi:hypothetical protein